MIKHLFRTNDKVVCIDDSPGLLAESHFLKKGVVYVVRDSFFNDGSNLGPIGEGLRLIGDPYQTLPSGAPCWWMSYRFRKLDEIKREKKEVLKEPIETPQDP